MDVEALFLLFSILSKFSEMKKFSRCSFFFFPLAYTDRVSNETAIPCFAWAMVVSDSMCCPFYISGSQIETKDIKFKVALTLLDTKSMASTDTSNLW